MTTYLCDLYILCESNWRQGYSSEPIYGTGNEWKGPPWNCEARPSLPESKEELTCMSLNCLATCVVERVMHPS